MTDSEKLLKIKEQVDNLNIFMSDDEIEGWMMSWSEEDFLDNTKTLIGYLKTIKVIIDDDYFECAKCGKVTICKEHNQKMLCEDCLRETKIKEDALK